MKYYKQNSQQGAVSLFVVIFAMLLISIVTIGFVRLMVQNQEQAINNDLSQSAYDSATAGTEDAKRALLTYRTACEDTSAAGRSRCSQLAAYLNSAICNEGVQRVNQDSFTPGEVLIQQSATDGQLDQAYTCVKIALQTDGYEGTLEENTSKLIPLKSGGAYNTVVLKWFVRDNLAGTNPNVTLDIPSGPAPTLYSQTNWGNRRPPLMRTQLMQVGTNGFTLTGFDTSAGSQSNANTMFLYPIGTTGVANAAQDTWNFSNRDVRRSGGIAPLATRCSGTLASGGYACTARLQLPQPLGNPGASIDRTAFLRLTALYNATDFRIELYNDATPVMFDSVQPSIDSTGRANDVFRRLESRVDLVNTTFPFPEATIDITGNLCKNSIVTNSAGEYKSGADTCTP